MFKAAPRDRMARDGFAPIAASHASPL